MILNVIYKRNDNLSIVSGVRLVEKIKKNGIHAILEDFKKKWHNIIIKENIVDLKECFIDKKGEYKSPKNFSPLPENDILAYIVKNADFAHKYALDKEKKKLLRDKYKHPIVISPDNTIKVIAGCLCPSFMRNVSFHELYDAYKRGYKVQGFKKWHIEKIIKRVIQEYPDFDVNKDTFFLFADIREKIFPKIKLNKLWLFQISRYGKESRFMMSDKEKLIIKELFQFMGKKVPDENNAFELYGRKNISETQEFLNSKFYLYHKI